MLETFRIWRGGIRLYIAIGIILVTIESWWWARDAFGGTNLYAIRLEEFYAWLALGLLGIAIAIGPTLKLFPRIPGKGLFFDARRMLGIGAAWFASLHAGIAYISSFKAVNPLDLPSDFQQSFLLGITAIVILLAMAGTSFDRAFKGMGIWWFRLHRLVYVAILVSLLHAFFTGLHATGWTALVVLSAAAVYVVGIHIFLAFKRSPRRSLWQLTTVSAMALLVSGIFYYGYTQRLSYDPSKAGQGLHRH